MFTSDISFTVHKATRRTHQPTMSDWKLRKGVSRYLKETKNLKLKMIVTRNEGNKVNFDELERLGIYG